MSTHTTPVQPQRSVTIGAGKAVHLAYIGSDGELYGSMCNGFAYESNRVRYTDAPATCSKCAKIAVTERVGR